MNIEDYLIRHTIVKIGVTLPGYICCEAIVDDPIQLLAIVRENNCYISEVRWWDCAKILSGSSIGYGGPRDPRCPKYRFFAETDIAKTFTPWTQDKEYKNYLQKINNDYSNFNLLPAFDIKFREDGSNPLKK